VGRRNQRLALGGGFELTLSCTTASPPKTQNPARTAGSEGRACSPAAGGTQRVPRIVPPQDAMQLLRRGEAINLENKAS